MFSVGPGDSSHQVIILQRLLRKNRWGKDFFAHKGLMDGQYGPHTLAAVREARYQLGYGKRRIRPGHVTQGLLDYLKPLSQGGKRISPAMVIRRKARLAASKVLPLKLRRYRVATRHLGYHEGISNHSIFGRWYGLDGNPWCAMFVSFCDVTAGGRFRYSYTPTISSDAYYGRNGLQRTYNPSRGDGVTYDWGMRHSVGGTDHVGIFNRWLDRRHGVFETIEGNTRPSSNVGPDGVYRRQRTTTEVVVFFTMH